MTSFSKMAIMLAIRIAPAVSSLAPVSEPYPLNPEDSIRKIPNLMNNWNDATNANPHASGPGEFGKSTIC